MYTLAKWNLDDYHRMIAAGILDDRHVELLNGEIVEMPPEKPIHADSNTDARDYLIRMLGGRAKVREQHPITLPDNSEPEPDLAIVKPITYGDRHPYPEDIFWLIEYANTSLDKDLKVKSKIYYRAGIEDYWVVDLKNRRFLVFRGGLESEYTDKIIAPLAFPDLNLEVAQITRFEQ